MAKNCEECTHNVYDEEYDEYICDVDLDMDEAERFMHSGTQGCPFYTPGDEYTLVKKQN